MKDVLRKHSQKRDDILNLMRSTKTHPSAEWIYASLKPRYPDLSLGTVYRNLALFVENGDAVSVGTVDGQERYDADTHPHPHFICERCRRVIDLDAPCIREDQLAEVEQATGFAVKSSSITLRGLCDQCLNDQSRTDINKN